MAHRNRSIPDGDPERLRWVRNFARVISEDPAAYGLTSEDADLLAGCASDLTAAYVKARRVSTRTQCTVRAKDVCMKRVLEVCRS
jgi:hypothetical protein